MLPEKRLFAYPGDQIRKAADRDIDLPRFQLRHKPGAPQRNRRKAHMRGGLLGPVLEPREGQYLPEIGRASCREVECQYVKVTWAAGKHNNNKEMNNKSKIAIK